MVKVSYDAEEQMKRLSSQERGELRTILGSGERTEQTTGVESSGKFVTRFGKNKMAVWQKESDGDVTVLAVVLK